LGPLPIEDILSILDFISFNFEYYSPPHNSIFHGQMNALSAYLFFPATRQSLLPPCTSHYVGIRVMMSLLACCPVFLIGVVARHVSSLLPCCHITVAF